MIKRVFISYSYLYRDKYSNLHSELKKYFSSKSIEVYSFVFDYKSKGTDREIMQAALQEIDKSDILLAETETMPLGVGLEVGYAYAKGKQVVYLYKRGSQKQQTISGVANFIIEYETSDEIINWFKNYFSENKQ